MGQNILINCPLLEGAKIREANWTKPTGIVECVNKCKLYQKCHVPHCLICQTKDNVRTCTLCGLSFCDKHYTPNETSPHQKAHDKMNRDFLAKEIKEQRAMRERTLRELEEMKRTIESMDQSLAERESLALALFHIHQWGYDAERVRDRDRMERQQRMMEQKVEIPITEQEVVNEYFKQSGGADSGLYMLDSLNHWRTGWLAAASRTSPGSSLVNARLEADLPVDLVPEEPKEETKDEKARLKSLLKGLNKE